ncbi:MAG: hypothetical protein WBX20_02625, partial [Terrimicrobiaceae bacterium]
DSAQQSCSASRSNFSSLSKWAIPPKETLSSKIGLRYKSDKLLVFERPMNFPSSLVSLIALVLLASTLLTGCIAIAPPPKPAGVVQVWVEQGGVRVLRNGQTLCIIHPRLSRVEQWKIVQNDTAIVIKSRTSNEGPAAVELFDINTGALIERLMTFAMYTGRPSWAEGFQD